MQTHGGAAAEAAITGRERYFSARLVVDWDNDGQFSHELSDLSGYALEIETDRSLKGTAPDEVMLLDGAAAAQLDATLAGEVNGQSLASAFSLYNGRSPLYRLPLVGARVEYDVIVHTAVGAVSYPQFRGIVREVTPDRAAGTVRLSCLDYVELMRAPVFVPPYGINAVALSDGWKRGQLGDSSALVDFAARAGGFTMGPRGMSWPAYMDGPDYEAGCVLSVPFHGSILPEVGTLDGAQGVHKTELWGTGDANHRARAEAYTAGPHGYLARQAFPQGEPGAYSRFWIDDLGRDIAANASTTFAIGGWFYWAGPDVDADAVGIEIEIRSHRIQLGLESSDGRCQVKFLYCTSYNNNAFRTGTWETINGPYSSAPTAAGWHYYEVLFKWYSGAGSDSGDIWVQANRDGIKGAPQLVANRSFVNRNDRFSGLVEVQNVWSVSDVQIFNVRNKPPLEDFTYDVTPVGNAAVSWGRNRFTYTLRENGLEAWGLATEVAAAEFGAVFFDELGRFTFWTYQDVLDRQGTFVRTLTVDDLSSLSASYNSDSVRNVWVVTTRAGKAAESILYDLARDGVPLRKQGDEYIPAVFIIPAAAPPSAKEFFFLPPPEAIAVSPWTIPTIQTGGTDPHFPGYWDQYTPRHGRQMYTGPNFIQRQDGSTDPLTEQKFTSRELLRIFVENAWSDAFGFVNPDGSARFRVEGLSVVEEEPKTWIIRDTDSIDQFGERVIELRGNRWLQDEWQTRAMLAALVDRTASPIPVTDSIEVPGDPRLQLGDAMEIQDSAGFGESIPVQILGVRNRLTSDGGFSGTLTVEAQRPAGVGIWNSSQYGRWDETFVWS
ncbi:hypothetical protein [Saccharopolyspora hattusasensis]|uniref:hypothetical protein n=1 Tax=Saccharopolyspora hattusasensis TaxID=1128679 RepID=UPI003D997E24